MYSTYAVFSFFLNVIKLPKADKDLLPIILFVSLWGQLEACLFVHYKVISK